MCNTTIPIITTSSTTSATTSSNSIKKRKRQRDIHPTTTTKSQHHNHHNDNNKPSKIKRQCSSTTPTLSTPSSSSSLHSKRTMETTCTKSYSYSSSSNGSYSWWMLILLLIHTLHPFLSVDAATTTTKKEAAISSRPCSFLFHHHHQQQQQYLVSSSSSSSSSKHYCNDYNLFQQPLLHNSRVIYTPLYQKLYASQHNEQEKEKEKEEEDYDKDNPYHPKTMLQNKFQEWGVTFSSISTSSSSHHYPSSSSYHKTPTFPSTTHTVASSTYKAITNTIYNSPSLKLDPNIASNAMSTNLYFDYRPTRKRNVGGNVGGKKKNNMDVSRLGVEIDGARYLMDDLDFDCGDKEGSVGVVGVGVGVDGGGVVRGDAEGRSIRKLSIVLAGMLSRYPWVGLEEEEEEKEHSNHSPYRNQKSSSSSSSSSSSITTTTRPVALYFNTVRQALLASQELQILKLKQEKYKLRHSKQQQQHFSRKKEEEEETDLSQHDLYLQPIYDNIKIFCLANDDLEIPQDMTMTDDYSDDDDNDSSSSSSSKKKKKKKKKPWGHSRRISQGTIDPTRGLILIVRPTDYNNEFKPPGPSIGTVDALQTLLARASVHYLPCVVLSPRLTEQMGVLFQGSSSSGSGGGGSSSSFTFGGGGSSGSSGEGWEQSGYQKSATYGGAEPPRGPTPWIVRDLYPPVYAWVGCGLNLVDRRPSLPRRPHQRRRQRRRRRQRQHDTKEKVETEDEEEEKNAAYYYWYHSRICMCQSVMDEDHPWNLFVVKETIYPNHHHHHRSSKKSTTPQKQQQSALSSTTSTTTTASTMTTDTSYEYIASTKTSSGRPTRDILRDVFIEWSFRNDDKKRGGEML